MLSHTTTLLSNTADAPKDRVTPYQLDVTRLPDQVLYVYLPCDNAQLVLLLGDAPSPEDQLCLGHPEPELVPAELPVSARR